MTTPQLVFSIAFGLVSLLIVSFAVYVFVSTMWGNRWVRPPKRVHVEAQHEGADPA